MKLNFSRNTMNINHNPINNETDSAKNRLIEAAYKLFSERDPSDISVRELAKEANVNIASINYYFESKEGLYFYIVNLIADTMRAKIDSFYEGFLAKKEAFERFPNNSDKMKYFYMEAFKSIIEYGARAMLETLSKNNFMHRIMLREQMMPGPAFSLLYEKSLQPLFTIVDDIISHIDTKSSEKTIKIRSHALYGQIIIFVCTYGTITKRIKSENYTQQCIEEIIAVVKEHTEIILKSFIEGN